MPCVGNILVALRDPWLWTTDMGILSGVCPSLVRLPARKCTLLVCWRCAFARQATTVEVAQCIGKCDPYNLARSVMQVHAVPTVVSSNFTDDRRLHFFFTRAVLGAVSSPTIAKRRRVKAPLCTSHRIFLDPSR